MKVKITEKQLQVGLEVLTELFERNPSLEFEIIDSDGKPMLMMIKYQEGVFNGTPNI